MNEKKRNYLEEAEQISVSEPDEKKYTLRGALQALERRQAAVAKRKEKILKLQAENKEDQRMIRRLQAICDELRQAEIMHRIGQLCSAGNEMTTERINKMLDFCELAGDALSEVSVEQLVSLIQGTAQPAEIAAAAQERYDANTGDFETEETEQEE